ncbi:hypothetical protein D9758_013076 [Tetrapyrgos nigripes]|uniref:JmjC domain-containing protein n=1 Tax=Tetrapyrgos nigripes TaxID=182062 RepID=A0A8H5FR72_9AGAR|nr:hypothetical protein D9758_013076 [Tetrapyrgos nigripes]
MDFRADCQKRLGDFKNAQSLWRIKPFLTPFLIIDKLLFVHGLVLDCKILRDSNFPCGSDISGLASLKNDWMDAIWIFKEFEKAEVVRNAQDSQWSNLDSNVTGTWLLHGLTRASQHESLIKAETNLIYAAIHIWWLLEGNLELPANLTDLPISTEVMSRLKLLKVHKGLGNLREQIHDDVYHRLWTHMFEIALGLHMNSGIGWILEVFIENAREWMESSDDPCRWGQTFFDGASSDFLKEHASKISESQTGGSEVHEPAFQSSSRASSAAPGSVNPDDSGLSRKRQASESDVEEGGVGPDCKKRHVVTPSPSPEVSPSLSIITDQDIDIHSQASSPLSPIINEDARLAGSNKAKAPAKSQPSTKKNAYRCKNTTKRSTKAGKFDGITEVKQIQAFRKSSRGKIKTIKPLKPKAIERKKGTFTVPDINGEDWVFEYAPYTNPDNKAQSTPLKDMQALVDVIAEHNKHVKYIDSLAKIRKDNPNQLYIFYLAETDFIALPKEEQQEMEARSLILLHSNPCYKRNSDLSRDMLEHLGDMDDFVEGIDYSMAKEATRDTNPKGDKGKILNLLDLPGPSHDHPFLPDLYTDAHARTQTHSIDAERDDLNLLKFLTWHICGTKDSSSRVHVDGEGLGTQVTLESGEKLWTVLLPPKMDFSAFAKVSPFERFTMAWIKKCKQASFKMIGLRLRPGMTLIMRPNMPHHVVTTASSLCHGAHFYTMSTISDSVYSVYNSAFNRVLGTNIYHHKYADLFVDILGLLYKKLPKGKTYLDDCGRGHTKLSHLPNVLNSDGLNDVLTLINWVDFGRLLFPECYGIRIEDVTPKNIQSRSQEIKGILDLGCAWVLVLLEWLEKSVVIIRNSNGVPVNVLRYRKKYMAKQAKYLLVLADRVAKAIPRDNFEQNLLEDFANDHLFLQELEKLSDADANTLAPLSDFTVKVKSQSDPLEFAELEKKLVKFARKIQS